MIRRFWSSTGQPFMYTCFCAASRRGSASVLYALLSRNYSSINTVCWSVPPVLYFLAAARFRFQSPLFLICSNFPVILRFSMNSTRRLQRWFVSKLGPSPVTTAAKPFFSIFSDTTRSVPPHDFTIKIGESGLANFLQWVRRRFVMIFHDPVVLRNASYARCRELIRFRPNVRIIDVHEDVISMFSIFSNFLLGASEGVPVSLRVGIAWMVNIQINSLRISNTGRKRKLITEG